MVHSATLSYFYAMGVDNHTVCNNGIGPLSQTNNKDQSQLAWSGPLLSFDTFYSTHLSCNWVTKAQIRLHICTVRSGSLLPAYELTVIILSIETGISKQCKPRSSATERGVRSGSKLFATHQAIF